MARTKRTEAAAAGKGKKKGTAAGAEQEKRKRQAKNADDPNKKVGGKLRPGTGVYREAKRLQLRQMEPIITFAGVKRTVSDIAHKLCPEIPDVRMQRAVVRMMRIVMDAEATNLAKHALIVQSGSLQRRRADKREGTAQGINNAKANMTPEELATARLKENAAGKLVLRNAPTLLPRHVHAAMQLLRAQGNLT